MRQASCLPVKSIISSFSCYACFNLAVAAVCLPSHYSSSFGRDGGLVEASACAFLSVSLAVSLRIVLALARTWPCIENRPLLRLHSNRDAREIEGRRKADEEEKLSATNCCNNQPTHDERRERRVFFFCCCFFPFFSFSFSFALLLPRRIE
jgi:hypothetical protein